MSIRFWLVIMIVVSTVMIDGFPYLRTLTEDECKAYFISNDINKIVYAYFNCPKKLRPKYENVKSYVVKRSLESFDDKQEKYANLS
ncbi:unnamed protein product [Adineta steineri]|nr:unnamed protein product [Adineta steineri]